MNAYGITDRAARDKNEDSILLNTEAGIFIVADGMGGHLHGDVASSRATSIVGDALLEGLLNADSTFLSDEFWVSGLIGDAVKQANADIYRISTGLPNREVIGTTVTLALFLKDKVYVGHVGDSRCYLMRNGNLELLTRDHSRAQELVEAGLLTSEEAENHGTSHILTKAVGVAKYVDPDISVHEIRQGDGIFLSSDGLFRCMNAEQVIKFMEGKRTMSEKCHALLRKVLEGGAPDNVSIIIVEPEKKRLIKRIFSRR